MIDVEVEDDAWTAALADAEALVETAAEATLCLPRPEEDGGGGPRPAEGVVEGAGPGAVSVAAPSTPGSSLRSAGGPPPPKSGEARSLTVLLTDDETVRDLNARFRDQDKPTNVLSFPAPENPAHHLGDIALAYGVCAREAAEQGKPLAHHLQHLVAHGVLHLLGYDHMSDDEAEVMEDLERAVLAGLGIADPYLAGEGDDERP